MILNQWCWIHFRRFFTNFVNPNDKYKLNKIETSKFIDNFFGLKDADNVYTSKSYKHSDEYADKYNATED